MDNFAGGGGASTGIEIATGKSVDIAINHDPEAIRMHRANHPHTKHYFEDNCMKFLAKSMINISTDRKCKDFEKGEYEGYKQTDDKECN